MAFNQKKEYALLMARSQKYATNISKMYSDAVNELLALAMKASTPEGEMFTFESNPKLAKQASDVLRKLQAATTAAIKKDIKLEWAKGNEAADKFLSTCFGKKVLNDPRFAGWTKRNNDALEAFLKAHTGGMQLSDKVWKTAEQLRTEMELAISVSMGSGQSASTISREVRQYLREPDKLFRRVKVGTDAEGNPIYKLSEAAKAYHPGQGVYRSSYKNAMRLARTETNAAYRTADSERWQQMDFVTGIHIGLSHSHPEPDICDTLQGDYPKDFKFTGWHPQCFCYATPILVDNDKFVEMQQAILRGETVDVSGQQITDMPENFVKWCENNKDRIALAKKEDRLPYFLKDNPDKLSEALSASQLKEALKTEEYKLGKEALGEMKGIPDMDTSAMEKALKKGDLGAIAAETEKFNQIKHELNNLTYVEGGLEQAKTWGYKAIMDVDKSVGAKIDGWSSLPLKEQAKKLDFEANKYLGGNMIHKGTGKPVQQLYPTWQVSQKAYLKELAAVQEKIEWQELNTEFNTLTTFNGGKGYDALQLKASNAFAMGDKAAAKAAMSDMQEYQLLYAESKSASKLAWSSNSKYLNKASDEFFEALAEGNIQKAKGYAVGFKKWETVSTEWESASKLWDGVSSPLKDKVMKAYASALDAGDIAKAQEAVADSLKWKDIIPAFKDAAAFKSKSAPYNKLVQELGDAIDAGDYDLAKMKEAEIAQKRALLDKKYGGKKKGGNAFSETYSQERKDNAIWDTPDKASAAGRTNGKLADDTLRPIASKAWQEAKAAPVDALGRTEADWIYDYTGHYCDVNEPLRGMRYYNSQSAQKFRAKVEGITKYIERNELPCDMWFQRGDNYLDIIEARVKFAGGTMPDGWRSDLSKLEGLIMEEGGFMSTGSRKSSGFLKDVTINIFAPKGTQAAYVEPFSQFGDGDGHRWNGVSGQSYFSSEHETLFQRNTRMRIIRAYKSGGRYFIDVEVIGQELRDIAYALKYI